MEPDDLVAWMALAWRSPRGSGERRAIALGGGPAAGDFPRAILENERADLAALEAMGVRLLTILDEEYPAHLREREGPLLLQVAGRPSLMAEDRIAVLEGARGAAAESLMEVLDSGGHAVVVLSKGLLMARSLLRALQEPLLDGSVALVSAEPPRASWGPARDRRRAEFAAALRR